MDIWVFGYGSLMWNPGFDPAERVLARLDGFSRSFCMWSIHHRGSVEDPGLVLALDQEDTASCEGVAFRLPETGQEAILQELRDRELISSAYVEETVTLQLRDGRSVRSLAYIINRDHDQYCAHLSLDEQAGIIAHAIGGRGPNTEYLYSTAEQLVALGIEDAELTDLAQRVRSIVANA